MTRFLSAAPVALALLAWPADAQPTREPPAADRVRATRIEQIPSPATTPTAETPLPAPDVRPPAQLSAGDRGGAPAQVGRAADARAPTAQVSRGQRSARGAPQLYRGQRSARIADPLSSRAQSPPGAVVRLEGKDRCDTGAKARTPVDCGRVIETRSAEFTRPNPLTLSPEQKLMVDQRLRQLPTAAENAVARIGRNEVDADAADSQSVASLVLAPPVAPAEKPVEKDPAAGLDAEVLSVIQALAGGTATAVAPPQ